MGDSVEELFAERGGSVEELRTDVERLERQLIEQEHRLWPAIRNFLALRDQRGESEEAKARFGAARIALIRRLIFRPGAIAITLGGAGLAGILITGLTALLFQEQNLLFQEQNALFREQNKALLDQFADESRDRTIARRAQLLDIIYSCGVKVPLCDPTAHPRARKEAAEAFVEIETRPEAGVNLSGARLGLVGLDLHDAELSQWQIDSARGNVETQLPDSLARPLHWILWTGPEAWKQWRREHPRLRPDLSGAFLSKADLSGADLSGANLKKANLFQADLSGANLAEADLSGADLRGANLDYTHLIGVDLREVLNLKQDQIDVAIGDEWTQPPSDLERPDSWPQKED